LALCAIMRAAMMTDAACSAAIKAAWWRGLFGSVLVAY